MSTTAASCAREERLWLAESLHPEFELHFSLQHEEPL